MNIKKIVVGITTFGVGYGAGYLISKKKYLEDLAEVKQFYYNKIEEMGVMSEDFEPDMEDQDEEDDDEEDEEVIEKESEEYFQKAMKYSSAIDSGFGSRGRPIINYNKPPLDIQDWGDLEEDPEDEEADDMDIAYEAELEARAEEFAKRKYENKINGLPYVIDYAEYQDGPEEYEREFLYYYSVDRVLCEEDDAIVEDEEELVGLDYEDVLDMQTTVWVRNDELLTLYEIHRIDESYKISVEGAVETPRERQYRILGRRKQVLDE